MQKGTKKWREGRERKGKGVKKELKCYVYVPTL